MASFPLPPWLSIGPGFFTQALEAGARTGLAVSEQAQRAQALIEARAERQAQLQQRADEQAERQRQFESSRLLDVQRLGQQAAELAQLGDYRQQQARHQAAQEANQAAQESRLLDYQKGMLGVAQHKADLDNEIAGRLPSWVPPSEGGAPGYMLDPRGGVHFPPSVLTDESRQRIGSELTTPSGLHAIWVGPNQIRLVDNGATKDFTQPQLLQYAKTIQYSPNPTNRAKAESILNFLGTRVEEQMAPKTNAPTVLGPKNAPLRGVTGTIHPWPKKKSELVVGDLYEHPVNGVGRWNGKIFEAVEVR